MIPHYELDTLPNPGWPRLYAVDAEGKRHQLNRQLWEHAIADGIAYARRGGFTKETGRVVDGLLSFFPEDSDRCTCGALLSAHEKTTGKGDCFGCRANARRMKGGAA